MSKLEESQEGQEPEVLAPEKTRAQIAEEDLEKIKQDKEKIKQDKLSEEAEEEFKGYLGDHKVAYDQYLTNKNKEDRVEKPLTEEKKEPQKTEKSEEPKKPEKSEESKESKKSESEAEKEKKAEIEKMVEDYRDLLLRVAKFEVQQQKRKDLSYKLKNILGNKKEEAEIDKECDIARHECRQAQKKIAILTGKSEYEVFEDYSNFDKNKGEFVKNVNKNLDNAEDNLKKEEESQSKEKKDLIERHTGIKDKRIKLLIKAVVAGGMIAFPVAGLAAGALGVGLGEALIGFSLIHYPSVAALAAGNAVFAVGGIGGGSVLLSKIMKEARELGPEEDTPKEENEEVASTEIPADDKVEREEISVDVPPAPEVESPKEDSSHEVPERETSEESESEKTEIKEDEFSNIKNFKELYSRLDEIGSIKSGEVSISSEEIKHRIDSLRFSRAEKDYDTITNKGGLRTKVIELIIARNGQI
jgi:hypothetical protein